MTGFMRMALIFPDLYLGEKTSMEQVIFWEKNE